MTLSQLLFSFALKEEENLGPTEGSLVGGGSVYFVVDIRGREEIL